MEKSPDSPVNQKKSQKTVGYRGGRGGAEKRGGPAGGRWAFSPLQCNSQRETIISTSFIVEKNLSVRSKREHTGGTPTRGKGINSNGREEMHTNFCNGEDMIEKGH